MVSPALANLAEANISNTKARQDAHVKIQAMTRAAGLLIDAGEPVFDTCSGEHLIGYTVPAPCIDELKAALALALR